VRDSKMMKDEHGDNIEVATHEHGLRGDQVYVGFTNVGDDEVGMYLKPKKARKLAKRIKRTAKAIEAGR
jgi:hypothetical protein